MKYPAYLVDEASNYAQDSVISQIEQSEFNGATVTIENGEVYISDLTQEQRDLKSESEIAEFYQPLFDSEFKAFLSIHSQE